ncbi:MAG: phosphoglycerate dehydrogenase [Nitrospirae bacterium]|nr:phosphoglycerate dehydrogenase [Nitrospirota bacterium]
MPAPVLIADSIAEEGLRVLRGSSRIRTDVRTGLAEKDLIEAIPAYEGLVVRSATRVTRPVIEAASALRVIARAGTGVDNIDVEAATKKGIVVMNTPGGNTITTGEHTFAMIMALCRKIPVAYHLLKGGKWAKGELVGVELYGKTLGIVGLGKIGRVVAERALAFKMRVIAFDPYVTGEVGRKLGVEVLPLEEVYRQADVLTLHTPSTPETKRMVDASAIAKMKKGVLLVNCARGELVDEAALLEALKSGQVAGAALDVFEKEPLPPDHAFLKLDNVVVTPHLGAATKEAQVNVAVSVAQQVVEFFTDGVAHGAVNFPSVAAETLRVLQPYMTLGERIGKLQAQMFRGQVTDIHIEYSGLVAEAPTEPITAATLKGFFTPLLTDRVTDVNAPVIARERGIHVQDTRTKEAKDFVSLVTITVGNANDRLRVAGTLFGQKEPRLVRINDFELEAVPEGTILILENDDKPGVIGSVGATLGENGVNIARMANGRLAPGGRAIALYNIDASVSAALLDELARLPNIRSALQVRL